MWALQVMIGDVESQSKVMQQDRTEVDFLEQHNHFNLPHFTTGPL